MQNDSTGTDPGQPGLDLLGIYLNDHRGGAAAGFVTARRCRSSNEGTELSEFLETMLGELGSEMALLDDVRHAIGARTSAVKRAAAATGAHLGRLKLNGSLFSYSSLSRVIELDMLMAGVKSKLTMWRTLDDLSARRAELARFDFTAVIAQAERQIDALDRFHREAVRLAFA